MTHIFLYFLVCLINVTLIAPAYAEKPVTVEDAIVAETEHFQILCYADKRCAAKTVTKKHKRDALQGLKELEKARAWLKGMGFDVENSNLDKGTKGKLAMRLQFPGSTRGERCLKKRAYACHILIRMDDDDRVLGQMHGRILLPIEYVDRLATGESLVHEFTHSLQPSREEGKATWLNEMVATAIGSAWVRKRTGVSKVYEPKYSMVLDREFYDGDDDPGFGKWDYAISLGNKIGSQDGVAYLAQDKFINASNNPHSRAGNSMALFYDKALVKSATFETFFPEYVARFNNVEYIGPETVMVDGVESVIRSGLYAYYGDIGGGEGGKYVVNIPDLNSPFQTEFAGEAKPFAAQPMLLSLKVPPVDDSDPRSNIFLAKVEVLTRASEAKNMRLVREHRLAVEKHRDFILIDGNAPPNELGFFRMVHTPAPDATDAMPFLLEVMTRPVVFDLPSCFKVGEPTKIMVKGLDDAAPDNWRLKVDNGSAEGLEVTPASAGEITIEVEIDSPITRADKGIEPKAPMQSRINLGTYDVARVDCMPPLAGNLVASYKGKLNDYWYSFGSTSHGSVQWQATLDVKTKSPRLNIDGFGDEKDVLVYPDDDSTYQLNGRFEFITCNKSSDGHCYHWTKEKYLGGGTIAADGGDLNIFSKDGKVWLEVALPVTTTINDRQGELEETQTYLKRWTLGCASSGQWWNLDGANFKHAMSTFNLESPVAGTWINKDHNEIEFQCNEQWGGEASSTGRYSASMKLLGRVKVKVKVQPR